MEGGGSDGRGCQHRPHGTGRMNSTFLPSYTHTNAGLRGCYRPFPYQYYRHYPTSFPLYPNPTHLHGQEGPKTDLYLSDAHPVASTRSYFNPSRPSEHLLPAKEQSPHKVQNQVANEEDREGDGDGGVMGMQPSLSSEKLREAKDLWDLRWSRWWGYNWCRRREEAVRRQRAHMSRIATTERSPFEKAEFHTTENFSPSIIHSDRTPIDKKRSNKESSSLDIDKDRKSRTRYRLWRRFQRFVGTSTAHVRESLGNKRHRLFAKNQQKTIKEENLIDLEPNTNIKKPFPLFPKYLTKPLHETKAQGKTFVDKNTSTSIIDFLSAFEQQSDHPAVSKQRKQDEKSRDEFKLSAKSLKQLGSSETSLASLEHLAMRLKQLQEMDDVNDFPVSPRPHRHNKSTAVCHKCCSKHVSRGTSPVNIIAAKPTRKLDSCVEQVYHVTIDNTTGISAPNPEKKTGNDSNSLENTYSELNSGLTSYQLKSVTVESKEHFQSQNVSPTVPFVPKTFSRMYVNSNAEVNPVVNNVTRKPSCSSDFQTGTCNVTTPEDHLFSFCEKTEDTFSNEIQSTRSKEGILEKTLNSHYIPPKHYNTHFHTDTKRMSQNEEAAHKTPHCNSESPNEDSLLKSKTSEEIDSGIPPKQLENTEPNVNKNQNNILFSSKNLTENPMNRRLGSLFNSLQEERNASISNRPFIPIYKPYELYRPRLVPGASYIPPLLQGRVLPTSTTLGSMLSPPHISFQPYSKMYKTSLMLSPFSTPYSHHFTTLDYERLVFPHKFPSEGEYKRFITVTTQTEDDQGSVKSRDMSEMGTMTREISTRTIPTQTEDEGKVLVEPEVNVWCHQTTSTHLTESCGTQTDLISFSPANSVTSFTSHELVHQWLALHSSGNRVKDPYHMRNHKLHKDSPASPDTPCCCEMYHRHQHPPHNTSSKDHIAYGSRVMPPFVDKRHCDIMPVFIEEPRDQPSINQNSFPNSANLPISPSVAVKSSKVTTAKDHVHTELSQNNEKHIIYIDYESLPEIKSSENLQLVKCQEEIITHGNQSTQTVKHSKKQKLKMFFKRKCSSVSSTE